ncbi:hypothetical protein A6V39_01935 [Candidatus Mycoplasma haematobovis]|uniref:Hypoxanthine-guanine phosphoribosyltransferase n=1 Tax=Candidatus Mycoplasma haematobovis TaxID=432608 RepID=A0A1A9QET1_9MOLU|nr:phosphoribosyltransferase family protein [Candidatus Mycoplasma haematobovis]OAL10190.1 hypothetical protein A6V39_01935 [Candidatus Mycoplasma haematobovis]
MCETVCAFNNHTTYEEWATVVVTHIKYLVNTNSIKEEVGKELIRKINEGNAEGCPCEYMDFIDFTEALESTLTPEEKEIINKLPEASITDTASKLIIKCVNDSMLSDFYLYADTLKKLALDNKSIYRMVICPITGAKSITSLGYQFALFFNSFREQLERLQVSRKYIEYINPTNSLSGLISYPIKLQDFMAKELDLFCFSPYSSENNWFMEVLGSFAKLGETIATFIKDLKVSGEVEFDEMGDSHLRDIFSAVSRLRCAGCKVIAFDIDLDSYRVLAGDFHTLFYNLDYLLLGMEIKAKSLDNVDAKYQSENDEAFVRIFEAEEKKEFMEEIYYEGAEIRNGILRLAQQLNNEYRNEKEPVVCVGFTEGVLPLLGQMLTHLHFPLIVVTAKVSLYGVNLVGDDSCPIDIEFDKDKFDNRRVIIFDDILDKGMTIKVYKSQMSKKVNIKDCKTCILFSKPHPERTDLEADFLGFALPPKWVIGYGLDTAYKYRNIDGVGAIKEKYKPV